MKLETNGHIGVDFWQGSMSDIAFLLIIFFILTALFTVPYVLRFISGGKDSTIVEKTDLSVIEIDQDGVMLFDGKPLERQRPTRTPPSTRRPRGSTVRRRRLCARDRSGGA